MKLRGVSKVRIVGPAIIPVTRAYVSQGMQALCMYLSFFLFCFLSNVVLAVVFGEKATDLIKQEYGF